MAIHIAECSMRGLLPCTTTPPSLILFHTATPSYLPSFPSSIRRCCCSKKTNKRLCHFQHQHHRRHRTILPTILLSSSLPSEEDVTDEQIDNSTIDNSTDALIENKSLDWKTGNVYDDLAQLERAIILANAEQNLLALERLEMLNALALQRRLLLPDLQRFVMAPLSLSLLFYWLIRKRPITSTSISTIRQFLAKFITLSMDASFWLLIVAAPILLLVVKNISDRRAGVSDQPPPELKGLDPEYFRFTTTIDWENPKTSCRDYSQCLLEWWVTSVAPMAVFGILWATSSLLLRHHHHQQLQNSSLLVGFQVVRHMAQLLTRLSAVASLHQFPKFLFQLQRPQQPRPIPLYPTLMQPLVKVVIASLPLAVAFDVAKVLQYLSWKKALAIYTTAFSLVASTALGLWLNTKHRHKELQKEQQQQVAAASPTSPTTNTSNNATSTTTPPLTQQQQQRLRQRLTAVASLGFLIVARWWWVKKLLPFWQLPFQQPTKQATCSLIMHHIQASYHAVRSTPTSFILPYTVLGLSMLMSITHLVALSRILRIQFSHNVPLSMEVEQRNAIFADPNARQRLFQWRYRLEWRQPQRLSVVLQRWQRHLKYLLTEAGSPRDQINQEYRQQVKQQLRDSPTSIWQRLEQERKYMQDQQQQQHPMEGFDYSNRGDRRQWKINAMQQLAARHQSDYERGVYEDPLGVAIQQTFGIGLGFGFDHMKPLRPGEPLTTRRLQTRAAKSAIQRVREIYNPSTARRVLDNIANATERDQMAIELRRQAKEEIQFLATKLSELIPTDPMPLDSTTGKSRTRVEQFNRNDFVRTSPNEMVIYRPMGPRGDDSPTIRFLLDEYDKSIYNPDKASPSRVGFVEAWMKQNRNWPADDDDDYNNSTEIPGMKTELV